MGQVIAFPANRISKGTHSYCPEMGQRKINCQIKLDMISDLHYYIATPIHLKGRGITVTGSYKQNGTKIIKYRTTYWAFRKLEQRYSIAYEELLD